MPSYPIVLIVLGFGQLLSWSAYYYSFSSFVLPMQAALGWDTSVIMGAFSLGLAVWAFATYAVGAAIDAGRGRVVLTAGPVLGGAGFLLWSQMTAPWMLYAAWCLIGLAMAMTLYEPVFTILTRRYPTRYRQGITTLTLIGGFASTVGFPAATLFLSLMDWRMALLLIGGLLIAVLAPLHGYVLAGHDDYAARFGPAEAEAEAPAESAWTLTDARRTLTFWLLTATFALYSFAAAALWAHVIPALSAKNLSTAETLAILVWIGPAQVFGRVLFAAFGTALKPHPTGVLVLCGLPLSFALFALATQPWQLVIFAVLFGASNGLVSIIRGSLLPDYFGRAHLGRIGGAMAAVALCARAAAPLGVAWLLLAPMGYSVVMLSLAGLGFVAVVAFALARRPPAKG